MGKLPVSFYEHPSVTYLGKELIGKHLCTYLDGVFCRGRIVETEAYCGASDKACHAHFNRFTKRTAVMFGAPGHAYVYLCYGIHALFNIVTNVSGMADAVLVRAVQPLEGLAHMLERRGLSETAYRLTAGPGAMSKAMGIGIRNNQANLQGPEIWIEDVGERPASAELLASPRVGIDYAGDDVYLPWRYRLQGNPWVSKAKANVEKSKKGKNKQ